MIEIPWNQNFSLGGGGAGVSQREKFLMVSELKYGLSVGILVTQRLSDRTRSTYIGKIPDRQ